jgi:hypothetical protein
MSGLVMWRTALVSLLVVAAITLVFRHVSTSYPVEYARTASVNTLAIFEVVYLVSARHLVRSPFSATGLLGNPVVFSVIGMVLLFQALFTYTPPF